jgi:hypothetical protein
LAQTAPSKAANSITLLIFHLSFKRTFNHAITEQLVKNRPLALINTLQYPTHLFLHVNTELAARKSIVLFAILLTLLYLNLCQCQCHLLRIFKIRNCNKKLSPRKI